MAPRSPQPPDFSDELCGVASRAFHGLHSALEPPPTAALLDRVDRDHTGPDAAVELLVYQGILCCRQIHRLGTTTDPPDEELAFLNLSMLDVVLARVADLSADSHLSDSLEGPHAGVQELMLRLDKDFGSLAEDD